MPSKEKEATRKVAVKEIDSAVSLELRGKGCTVYYEKSVTKNLGNFESAKVTVGVTLPIRPTEQELHEIQATIEVADELVTAELEVQLKEITTKK